MKMLEAGMLQACRPSDLLFTMIPIAYCTRGAHVSEPSEKTFRENLPDERHGETSRRLDDPDPWGDWCEVIQADGGGLAGDEVDDSCKL